MSSKDLRGLVHAACLTRPPLDAVPAPYVRTPEASNGSREPRAARENRDTGPRDVQLPGYVRGDHEFRTRVQLHLGKVNSGYVPTGSPSLAGGASDRLEMLYHVVAIALIPSYGFGPHAHQHE